MFGFLLFYSLIHLFFDNAGMESGECSRMIGRCTEHFFCLKIGKIDVTGSDVDIGVIALCQFLISTAVIFDHTKGRIVFGIALIKNTASVYIVEIQTVLGKCNRMTGFHIGMYQGVVLIHIHIINIVVTGYDRFKRITFVDFA